MKLKQTVTHLFLMTALTMTLNACGTFFDKDNTPQPAPLVNFKPQAHVQSLWSTSTGNGANSDYLKLTSAISGKSIFTASTNGTVSANDITNG